MGRGAGQGRDTTIVVAGTVTLVPGSAEKRQSKMHARKSAVNHHVGRKEQRASHVGEPRGGSETRGKDGGKSLLVEGRN